MLEGWGGRAGGRVGGGREDEKKIDGGRKEGKKGEIDRGRNLKKGERGIVRRVGRRVRRGETKFVQKSGFDTEGTLGFPPPTDKLPP